MKTRAAIAFEKAEPLEIIEIGHEGPKQGEVLVEIKATGICHPDEFTLFGADDCPAHLNSGTSTKASTL